MLSQRCPWCYLFFCLAGAYSILAGVVQAESVDNSVRNLLKAETPEGRSQASTASDILLITSSISPFAFDAFQRRTDFTHPHPLIADLSAMTITASFTQIVKPLANRERPYGQGCQKDSAYHPGCSSPDRSRSFFSGHSAITFTSAGLFCSGHLRYPASKDSSYYPIGCAITLAVAVTTATLRIVADQHYFSDVTVGAVLGFAIGYGMSLILHSDKETQPPTGLIPSLSGLSVQWKL